MSAVGASRHTCVVRALPSVSGEPGATGDVVVQVGDGALLIAPFVGQLHPAIPVGCRGGGCGVCRVQVLEGEYEPKRMSRRFVSEDDARAHVVLACRVVVTDDLVVRPCPPS